MDSLGKKLKDWRKREGLAGEEAAKKLGISQSQWSKYELNSRRVHPARANILSGLTGIPLHEIRPDIFQESAE